MLITWYFLHSSYRGRKGMARRLECLGTKERGGGRGRYRISHTFTLSLCCTAGLREIHRNLVDILQTFCLSCTVVRILALANISLSSFRASGGRDFAGSIGRSIVSPKRLPSFDWSLFGFFFSFDLYPTVSFFFFFSVSKLLCRWIRRRTVTMRRVLEASVHALSVCYACVLAS